MFSIKIEESRKDSDGQNISKFYLLCFKLPKNQFSRNMCGGTIDVITTNGQINPGVNFFIIKMKHCVFT